MDIKIKNDDFDWFQPIKTKVVGSLDPINHPPHYNMGKFECIDVIEDWNLGYHLGCAVKYIARCNHKGSKKQDLQKAMWYLQREIDKS